MGGGSRENMTNLKFLNKSRIKKLQFHEYVIVRDNEDTCNLLDTDGSNF